jgi:hypothetical protein
VSKLDTAFVTAKGSSLLCTDSPDYVGICSDTVKTNFSDGLIAFSVKVDYWRYFTADNARIRIFLCKKMTFSNARMQN